MEQNNIHRIVAKSATEALIHRKQIRHLTLEKVENTILSLGLLGVETSKLDVFSDKKGGVFIEYHIFDHVDPALRSMGIIRIAGSGVATFMLYTQGQMSVIETLADMARFIKSMEGETNVHQRH